MNFKKESVFWLLNNKHMVATILSGGNTNAYAAVTALLENSDGAQAFQDMKTELSAEEWEKLYRLCENDNNRVVASVIVMNSLVDDQLIHKNFELKYPAVFSYVSINGFYNLGSNERWRITKQLREDFLKRFKEAKLCRE